MLSVHAEHWPPSASQTTHRMSVAWLACLSLGLTHHASHVCREPVPLCPQEWLGHSPYLALTESVDSLPVLFSSVAARQAGGCAKEYLLP